MGIKGFGKWTRTNYPLAFKPTEQPHGRSFNSVYVDMNGILHCAARTAITEANLFTTTKRFLRDIVRLHRPEDKLFLAIDGPASLMKLDEQRKRRLDAGLLVLRNGCFDTRQFTPGCMFMTRLENFIIPSTMELLLSSKRKHNSQIPLELIVSGAATAGEGETKIFNDIINGPETLPVNKTRQPKSSPDMAIITTDSDALLQAIACGIKGICIISPPWESSNPTLMMADQMLLLLTKEANRDANQVQSDFAFLVTLSGNDYLPSMQFGNYACLWPIYCKETHLRLIDQNSGKLRLNDFIELLSIWKQSPMFISHAGFQRSALAALSQMHPDESLQRTSAFLKCCLTLTNQITGKSKDKSISIDYPFSRGPSIGEILENKHLASQLDKSLEEEGNLDKQLELLPATAAILMLKVTGEEEKGNLKFLPSAIHALAIEFNQLKSNGFFKDDREAAVWLNDQQKNLAPQDALERNTIIPRPPQFRTIQQPAHSIASSFKSKTFTER